MTRVYYSEFYPASENEGVVGTTVPSLTAARIAKLLKDLDLSIEDGILTRDEKIRVIIPLNSELSIQYQSLLGKATVFDLNTDSMTTAWNDWVAYRNSLEPAWNDTTVDTEIDRVIFRALINNLLVELAAMDRAIIKEAARRADIDGGLTDGGKPIDREDVLTSEGTAHSALHLGLVGLERSAEEILASLDAVDEKIQTSKDNIIGQLGGATSTLKDLIDATDADFDARVKAINDQITLVNPTAGTIGKRVLDSEAKTNTAIIRISGIENVTDTLNARVVTLESIVEGIDGSTTASRLTSLEQTTATTSGKITNLEEITTNGTFVKSTVFNTIQAEVIAARAGEPNLSAKITSVLTTVANGDSTLTSALNTLRGRVDTNDASISGLASDLVSVNTSLTGKATVEALSTLSTKVTGIDNTVSAQNTRLNTAESNIAGKASASSLDTLVAEVVAARVGQPSLNTRITSGLNVLANADGVLSTRLSTVEGEVTTAQANISGINTRYTELELSVSGKATITDYNSLKARVDTAEGSISGFNTRFSTIEANVSGKASASDVFNMGVEIANARNGAASLTARISTVMETIANGDGVLSSRIDTLNVSVDGQNASITAINQVAIDAKGIASNIWGITQDVNGYVSGISSINNGTKSSFTVLADKFAILQPGTGAKTEYSGGHWRVYSASGKLRVRMGVW